MSLVGNLEDLGLGDILQIVSLSRKSGILSLCSSGREGKIVFHNGQVIQATTTTSKENLGDLLVRRGVVEVEILKKALALQANSQPMPRIGTILANNFGISGDRIENIVKEKIENTVYGFFGWTEGSFSFELSESNELAATHLNPLQFMLEQGLNPQWLAMEGSRIFDEARQGRKPLAVETRRAVRDLENLEASAPAASVAGPLPGKSGRGPIEGQAPRQKPEDPDSSGKDIKGEFPKAGSVRGSVSATVNLGAEILRELGEGGNAGGQSEITGNSGLILLKGMLQELNDPALGGGIILLVLRFASEFMNRAVIFLIKNRQIVGLGQFGIEADGDNADARVRRIKIPCGEGSIFSSVLQQKVPVKIEPGDGPWDSYLEKQLGGGAPPEVFLGPIVSEGKVVAVLYGDNLPEGRPIGETESLEIFLSQAGIAMDKGILEKRLKGEGSV